MIRFARVVTTVLTACSALAIMFTILCRDAEAHFTGINVLDDRDNLTAFFTRFYYTVVIASTTGLGDICPISARARTLTVITIITLMGILFSMVPRVISDVP